MKIDFIADTNFLIYLHEGNKIVENPADSRNHDSKRSHYPRSEVLQNRNEKSASLPTCVALPGAVRKTYMIW